MIHFFDFAKRNLRSRLAEPRQQIKEAPAMFWCRRLVTARESVARNNLTVSVSLNKIVYATNAAEFAG
jgi:hypothetical protein